MIPLVTCCTIQTAYEPTHFKRLHTREWNKRDPETPHFCHSLNYIIQNTRIANEIIDIEDKDYDDPKELMVKYKQYFADANLIKLQTVNEKFQQLKRTKSTELVTELMTKLRREHLWYKYLFAIIEFFDINFPPPFNLINADLLRKGNTFDEWFQVNNQSEFNVLKHGKMQTILYPSYPAPAAIYRHIQTAMHSSFKLSNYCFRSERQLQCALVGFHLWHENSILYQHKLEKGGSYLMLSSKQTWQTRKNVLGCYKTIESLHNNKYTANSRQNVSNQNEQAHMELKTWLSFFQICGPFLWMFYLNLMELKHDYLALKFIKEHRQRFPNLTDKYIDDIWFCFDAFLSFRGEFKMARKHGYDSITIKPNEQDKIQHYIDRGIVERLRWNYKQELKLINYVLSKLKLIENPQMTLTQSIVDHCWDKEFKQKFDKTFIANQLRFIFFKYLHLMHAVHDVRNPIYFLFFDYTVKDHGIHWIY